MAHFTDGDNFGSDEFNAYMTEVQENQTEEQTKAAQEKSVNDETGRIFDEMEKPGESDGQENLRVLGQTPSNGTGDFVFNLQGHHGKGTDEKFTHVHKDWMKNGCMSFDDALEQVDAQRKQLKDYNISLRSIRPIVDDGKIALEFPDGAKYYPTAKCLQDFATVGRTSGGMLKSLVEPIEHSNKKDKQTGEKIIEFERDEIDAGLAVTILENTLFRADRIDQDKIRLFRCWSDDNTLRTMLSEKYAIVNNAMVLEWFKELIPGGMVSHFKGDADRLACNILIPDSIREEEDSDYGGMISCGNSEIGTGNIFSQPSVFRSICMNGCIWGGEKGTEVKKRHRGEIDLAVLKEMIRHNLQKQIPLINDGIDLMLDSKKMKCEESGVMVSMRKMFAEISKWFKLSKVEATNVMQHWSTEHAIIGDAARSNFGIQAALTRYGQTVKTKDGRFDTDTWQRFDRMGGELMTTTETVWNTLVKRAATLSEKELEKAFIL